MEETKVLAMMEKMFEVANKGIPNVSEPAQIIAEQYMKKHDSVEEAAKAMINDQILKCGASGFITGLGGLVTLPVAITANVGSVLYMQMRMTVTLAYMGGFDIDSEEIKTWSFACLLGYGITEILKDMSIKASAKLGKSLLLKTSEKTLYSISARTLNLINKKIATKLAEKLATKGATYFSKALPVLGGVVGGAFDLVSTKAIAKVSYDTFIKNGKVKEEKMDITTYQNP